MKPEMASEEQKWLLKKKQSWDKSTGRKKNNSAFWYVTRWALQLDT